MERKLDKNGEGKLKNGKGGRRGGLNAARDLRGWVECCEERLGNEDGTMHRRVKRNQNAQIEEKGKGVRRE